MAHAIWSGAINFGLVTIPVKVFTAVKTDELSFNMLHKKDEGRIKYERVCSVDGKPVPWDEIVKGYEYEKGQYAIVTDEELKKITPPSGKTMEILAFVQESHVDPIYFDSSFLSVPEAEGRKGYALLLMNKKDAGVHELRALIQKHPDKPEAMQARSKLNGMGVKITPTAPTRPTE